MRFTLAWLKHFLDTDATLEKIAHTLTMTGLEIEDIDDKFWDQRFEMIIYLMLETRFVLYHLDLDS